MKRGKPLQRKTPLNSTRWGNRDDSKRRAARMASGPKLKKRTMRATKKRRATPEEKVFMGRVAQLGCIVSRNLGLGKLAPCLHHVRTGYGASEKASNWEVIPLTRDRHQDGGMGIAFHAGPRTWQAKFGTEIALLKQVYDELGIPFEDLPKLRGSEPPWWPQFLDGTALVSPAAEIFKEEVHDDQESREETEGEGAEAHRAPDCPAGCVG